MKRLNVSPDLKNPDRWTVFENRDFWESNISRSVNAHRICERDSRYVAFNSLGYGKHTVDLNHLYVCPSVNLYVKRRRIVYVELIIGDRASAVDALDSITDVFVDYYGEFPNNPKAVRSFSVGDHDHTLNTIRGTEYDRGTFRLFSEYDLSSVLEPRPKRVGFLVIEYTERGTCTAVYDYADLNETVLGNASVILELESTKTTDEAVHERFRSRFTEFRTVEFTEDSFAGLDAVYVLTYGGRMDEPLQNPDFGVRFIVHCVFDSRFSELNGLNTRTVVLSNEMNRRMETRLPVLNHVVRVHPTTENLRSELGIPEDAVVFGYYGGYDSFNIEFAHEALIELSARAVDEGRPLYFVLMNSQVFGHGERILYLDKSIDSERKRKFINTCDAMLHARWRGETFGLACAEFGVCGRPIITYTNCIERNHIEVLRGQALLYEYKEDLSELLWKYDPREHTERGRLTAEAYSVFSTQRTMSVFNGLLV